MRRDSRSANQSPTLAALSSPFSLPLRELVESKQNHESPATRSGVDDPVEVGGGGPTQSQGSGLVTWVVISGRKRQVLARAEFASRVVTSLRDAGASNPVRGPHVWLSAQV